MAVIHGTANHQFGTSPSPSAGFLEPVPFVGFCSILIGDQFERQSYVFPGGGHLLNIVKRIFALKVSYS